MKFKANMWIFAMLVPLALSACEGYSSGERVGVISKFSSKGLFCKSWEGELSMGGFRNSTASDGSSQVVANIFEFSVIDPRVVEEVEAALRDGDRVAMKYEQKLLPGFCERSTGYVITGVEKLNN